MNKELVKLIFSGDLAPITYKIESNEKHFKQLEHIMQNCDLHITDLECPITETTNQIEKSGPHIKASASSVNLLNEAHVSIACLANNHIFDYGEPGINDTIEVCEAHGVDTLGIVNRSDNKPAYLIKEIKGKKIGFINYCEHEFSVRESGELGANGYDSIRAFYEITVLKTQTDYIIVIYHGGNEYYNLPSPELKNTFHFLADLGADAVIGHHTHVYSGFEFYKGKPLVYSLGNFYFPYDNEPASWHLGIVAKLTLSDKIGLELIPILQCKNNYKVTLLSGERKQEILDKIEKLSSIIGDDVALEHHWTKFVRGKRKGMIKSFPCMSLLHRAALKLGFPISFFIPDKRLRAFENILRCQAHANIFKRIIKNKY